MKPNKITTMHRSAPGSPHLRPGTGTASAGRITSAAALCLLLLLIPATLFGQSTIRVPGDQPTIQAGIDAAANGDTVSVAPGTYNETIDFKGKAISVISSGGNGVTFIDGGNQPGVPVVTFKSGELRTSVLAGFTIQHGGTQTASSQASGGIYIHASAPYILGNIISANHCSGIYANGGALIQANIVSGTLYQNPGSDTACQQGGTGIVVQGTTTVGSYSHVDILANIVNGNTQAAAVGGIAIIGAEGTTVQSNTIDGNLGGIAGGIGTTNTQALTIVQNLVVGNGSTANNPGGAGGIAILVPQNGSSTPPRAVVAQNTIANNQVQIGIRGESATELNLTGAISQFVIANNISVGSSGLASINCSVTYASLAPTPPVFDHNDVFNPNGPTYGGACPDQTGNSGNISADPLFATPGRDYHLTAGSPAIDTGSNDAYALSPIDIAGLPRIVDATGKGHGIVDMGVNEFPGTVVGSYNVVLTSSLNPAPFGQQVTFAASVTANSTNVGTPAGTVVFSEGSTVLATRTVQSASPLIASASFPISTLATGSHVITATFTPSSGAQGASDTRTETITGVGTSTAVVSSANPSQVSQPVTFTATVTSSSPTGGNPSGTVRFLDGTTVIGTQSLTPSGSTAATASYTTSALAAGTHTITASYDGSAALSPSSATLTQTVAAGSATTTSTITGTPNPAPVGTPVNFLVTVASSGSAAGPPTGTVTLTRAGNIVLATQPLSASGAATSQVAFIISTLPVGAQAIQATFNPTGSFLTSTASMTETITATAVSSGDFTLTPGQLAISIKTQHHTTTGLTLTSLANFQDSIGLSCGNLPAYVTCRFTPATAALTAGGTSSVSLYIDTDSVIGYAALHNPTRPSAPWSIPPATGFAVVLPACLAFSRRRLRGGASPLRLLLLMLASCAAMAGLSGCGNLIIPANLPPSAAPGTYTIPITATGASTGVTHTSTLTLTVTP